MADLHPKRAREGSVARNLLLGAAGFALLLLISLWALLPSSPGPPESPVTVAERSQDPPPPTGSEVNAPEGEPHGSRELVDEEGVRRGPDGQPLPPDTPRRHAGLPRRPPEQAPLDDADAWQEQRERVEQDWRQHVLQSASSFADERDFSPDDRQQMLTVLEAFQVELGRTRAAMASGDLPPRDGRARVAELRTQTHAEMVALLGETQAEALRQRLNQDAMGGF